MPEAEVLTKEVVQNDPRTKHSYVLCAKNETRGMTYMVHENRTSPIKDPEYPKQRNVLLRSSIIWPKGRKDPFSGKERNAGRHLIRYYDGCTTLFVDDQPKDRETIEQLSRSTRDLFFQNGYLHVYEYDAMLKNYLDWASWNEDSEYRVPTVDPIYKKLDADAARAAEAVTLDDVEKALAFAKSAKDKDMIVHARFLDVPTIDYNTGQELSIASIRTEYRKAAMYNTKRFLQTYNDKTLHLRYWIQKGLDNGDINTKVVPSKASWGKKGRVICDISGLESYETILNKLVEFSQTDEGAEFKQQLEALYNN